jgi:hypothetical protein
MRKYLSIVLLIFGTSLFSEQAVATRPVANAEKGIPYKYTPAEGSIEELYKDIIVVLIEPYITEALKEHYGRLLQYDLFGIEFLKIERAEYRSFDFLIKLQIQPFVGAHNFIGIDNITMRVSPVETKVLKFKHIKSFPLPSH